MTTTGTEIGWILKGWNWCKGVFASLKKRYERLAALESRVTALEKALERCPGEACPFCGARAWYLKVADMHGQHEQWHCLECKKERGFRYDLPGRLPPNANPNATKPRR